MRTREKLALMGTVVTVTVELLRHVDHHPKYQAEWRRSVIRAPWAGWVVGFRHKQSGHVRQDWDDRIWIPEGKPTPVLLVTPWPTMNARIVPLDGYAVGGEPRAQGGWMSEKNKERVRKESKDWARDAKGRWIVEPMRVN